MINQLKCQSKIPEREKPVFHLSLLSGLTKEGSKENFLTMHQLTRVHAASKIYRVSFQKWEIKSLINFTCDLKRFRRLNEKNSLYQKARILLIVLFPLEVI